MLAVLTILSLTAPQQLLSERPAGEKPFLTATLTLDDIAGFSEEERSEAGSLAKRAGGADDERTNTAALFLLAALREAEALGAEAYVHSPVPRVEQRKDRSGRAYAADPTVFVEYFRRQKSGGRLGRIFFAEEAPPRGTCDVGRVSVTGSHPAARPSRLELLSRVEGDLRDEVAVNARFIAAPIAGRTLVAEVHAPTESGACEGAAKSPPGVVKIKRRGDHFYANIVVNGVDLGEAMIDTGASALVLPAAAAARVGLHPSRTTRANTASGTITVGVAIADDVRVAGLRARRVETLIIPGGRALVGMSALEPFSLTVNGSTLTLSPR